MKKIVPFIKNIDFDTNIEEVVSISLDKKINNINSSEIDGEFELYLEYKESDVSQDILKYSTTIPFNVDIDNTYLFDNAKIDIDDFYYELDDNTIILHIDLVIDNIKYNDVKEVIDMCDTITDEDDTNSSTDSDVEVTEIKTPIYQTFDPKTDNYVTYNVHIVRENDNIDSICLKYGVTKDDLSYYNDISSIKLGDKLIVPTSKK